jgi:hypothetical protein
LRKERTTTNGIEAWSLGQRSHFGSGGTLEISGLETAKQTVETSSGLRTMKNWTSFFTKHSRNLNLTLSLKLWQHFDHVMSKNNCFPFAAKCNVHCHLLPTVTMISVLNKTAVIPIHMLIGYISYIRRQNCPKFNLVIPTLNSS